MQITLDVERVGKTAYLVAHHRLHVMRNATDRKHVLQLSRQGCIRIRRITVVLLGFLSVLRTKESGVVGVLAMHQRDEPQITELLLATIRESHFRWALQCQLSVIGLEG